MKTINAQLLKKMFISASNNLYNHYPEIDALNVFPVPDGDTGLNMNSTLSSGVKDIQFRNDNDVYTLASCFSDGAFMGARGNSGAITSQIFKGFAHYLKDKNEIDLNTLVLAFQGAKEFAYKAVIKPVEGTILTVIRETSDYLKEHIEQCSSIEEAFDLIVSEAKKSLDHTPELLPVLKEVGVVDSGGAGLLKIFEGMKEAVHGNYVEKKTYGNEKEAASSATTQIGENEEFGYCTELIMELGPDSVKKAFNENKYVSVLQMHGNSLVFVKNGNYVKVHIHTMTPGWVLNYSQQFGEFKKLKIENMTEQHNELMLMEKEKEQLALNTESKEEAQVIDLDEPKAPEKEFGIIATCSGEGIADMFKEIGVDEIVSGGQTMNPSTEDFVSAIKKVNAKNVFILPNNSNIIMAATLASDITKNIKRSKVIPSTTIPQGLVAAMTMNPDANYQENSKEMKKSLKTVKTSLITYATRDTNMNGIKIVKNDFIALVDKKVVCCVKDKFEALYKALDKIINQSSSIVTIFTGNDITKEEREKLSKDLTNKYEMLEVDVRDGKQPVYSFIIGVE